MSSKFRPGEIWINTLGGEVEIVLTGLLEINVSGRLVDIEVVACRFPGGGGRTSLRTVDSTKTWRKKEY